MDVRVVSGGGPDSGLRHGETGEKEGDASTPGVPSGSGRSALRGYEPRRFDAKRQTKRENFVFFARKEYNAKKVSAAHENVASACIEVQRD